ncbi:hypothetical protein [Mycobacterium parmense]|uniref:Uncharacterized protein n=1 Tax=Mycobacterium parmense TaxID=185642 RepID=A0A7I7YXG9_9MYCO|nr:hypothetical protein [Mycobacterium parmense]MCV7350017.1 hypothetical protein [Mycobacterium parmense]ORW59297.1 hypothetical protein AWC20_10145 [Mycobacterium parmense]BBZ46450.1 hypothetical protein MPRM_37310 [Mycobacterium parmense]
MALFVTQRFSGGSSLRCRARVRAGRLLTKVRASRGLSAQERADLYVSRMPIAVVTAPPGGHPPREAGNRR